MDKRFTVYEQQTRMQLVRWEKKLLKPPGLIEKTSKTVQTRINRVIPDKVHSAITAAVKGIVRTALFSMDYMPKNEPLDYGSLAYRDHRAEDLISLYKKLAAAEGAGTGAGGLLLGFADFPILIGIKMKFLFELAHVYGRPTSDYWERLFILHVFQLAFSSQNKKPALLQTIKDWNETTARLPAAASYTEHVDWQQLQQEYRDTLDFRKMLQLVPGIGAVVGAWANYGLLEELGEAGMNCYRLRWLQEASLRDEPPADLEQGWIKPSDRGRDQLPEGREGHDPDTYPRRPNE
ncbi:EcsC family protein [Paenibacillus filicis]|uniref:EcsC family protein n=1 Tax=Paenibacillus gyeongsangnamensis TaxID=3388067 RepID=A0ABT4Q9R1_9BACL|nr:EcsC family protein [Paenibacillus filicis]MCZ8513617.1 EcsC family protein [Paenibacillus filicis]